MNPSVSGSSSDISPINVISSSSNYKPEALTEEERAELRERQKQRTFLQGTAKLALRHAADSRRRYDFEWMQRDLFRRGYMFSRYQPSAQTVMLASRQSAKVPINLALAQMRSIINQVTSFRPKFEVMPRYSKEDSNTDARYSGKLLDYYFDHLNLKKKIKETVTQGLMYSIGGPWQVVYDEEKKEINVWLVDPFDWYVDPLAEDPEEAEYQIKAVRRPLGEIIYNDEYDKIARREVTGGEGRLAVSEYKQFMLQALHNATQYNRDESPTVILFEGYFRIHEEDEEPHLRKVVWTDQNSVPLVYEDLDTNEYDFEVYQADLNPKEIYGESWFKHVMPINRAINSLESSIFDYNYKVAKGRFIVDKDSGIRAIHNIHGEIISANRGSRVQAMDMPSLPVATTTQVERLNRYLEDIGTAHDASMGRVPPGVKSGVGVAELKQADATGQDNLVDNLEDFLTRVARKMLKKIAQNYTTVQVIQDLGYREEEEKYFAVIGAKGSIDKAKKKFRVGPDEVDIARIGEDNNVRVTIGSWLGYTKEMMQEKTLKLLQLGAIDQKTFLKLWEFGDVDKIVQQTRTEGMLKSRMGANSAAGVQPVDPYVENEMMVQEGKPVMPDAHDDHWVHIAVHQEALGQGADELVQRHIAAHQMYLQAQGGVDIDGQGGTISPSQDQPPVEDQTRNAQVQAQQPQGPQTPPDQPVSPMIGAPMMPAQ